MPTEPKRQQILDNLQTAVQTITTANGYHHNVKVVSQYLRTPFDTKEFPAVYLTLSEERKDEGHNQMFPKLISQAISYIKNATEERIKSINRLIQDIEKAVTVDRTRGGLALDTIIRAVRLYDHTTLGEFVIAEIDIECSYEYLRGQA